MNDLKKQIETYLETITGEHSTWDQMFYYNHLYELREDALAIMKAMPEIHFFVPAPTYQYVSLKDTFRLASTFLKKHDLFYDEKRFSKLWNQGNFDFSVEKEGFQIERHKHASANLFRQLITLSFLHNITDASFLVHEWSHIADSESTFLWNYKSEMWEELKAIHAENLFLLDLKQNGWNEKELHRQLYLRLSNSFECLKKFIIETELLTSYINDPLHFDANRTWENIVTTQFPSMTKEQMTASQNEIAKNGLHAHSCYSYIYGTLLSFYLLHHHVSLAQVQFAAMVWKDPNTYFDDVMQTLGIDSINTSWQEIVTDAVQGFQEAMSIKFQEKQHEK